MEHTVTRDGERDLEFDGALIGSGSSHRPGRDRWFEVSIFSTDGGQYVVAGAGVSDRLEDEDRCWAHVCATADEVIAVLQRDELACGECGDSYAPPHGACPSCGSHDRVKTGVKYLTRTAQRALDHAAKNDRQIAEANTVKVA